MCCVANVLKTCSQNAGLLLPSGVVEVSALLCAEDPPCAALLNAKDRGGKTALHHAAASGRADVPKLQLLNFS